MLIRKAAPLLHAGPDSGGGRVEFCDSILFDDGPQPAPVWIVRSPFINHRRGAISALAKEITKVIGGIVLPIVGIIAGIPLVAACISGVVLAVVGAIFGPIATYAATC